MTGSAAASRKTIEDYVPGPDADLDGKEDVPGSGTWATVEKTRFIYAGWHLLAELAVSDDGQGGETLEITRRYTWGLDASGTLGGAGGVGGLLGLQDANGTPANLTDDSHYAYSYDGNGNGTHLINLAAMTAATPGDVPAVTAAVGATYQYDPFGRRLNAPAPGSPEALAEPDNPFRFSTRNSKANRRHIAPIRQDYDGLLPGFSAPRALYYVKNRYYSPTLGRFINRDPIGELGGINLYAYVGNDPLGFFDPFGLDDMCGGQAQPGRGRRGLEFGRPSDILYGVDCRYCHPRGSVAYGGPSAPPPAPTIPSSNPGVPISAYPGVALEGLKGAGQGLINAGEGATVDQGVFVWNWTVDWFGITVDEPEWGRGLLYEQSDSEYGWNKFFGTLAVDAWLGKAGLKKALEESAETIATQTAKQSDELAAGLKAADEAVPTGRPNTASPCDDVADGAKAADDAASTALNSTGPIRSSALTQQQQRAVSKIDNALRDHMKPHDISGAVADQMGSPIPKPGGGYWNHAQEMQDTLRGLRKNAAALEGVVDPAAQAARQRALDAIKNVEDALKGAGL